MTRKIKTIESEGGIRFVVKTQKAPNNFQNYFKSFAQKTHLYGFVYLGESQRYVIERIYWILFIFLSLFLSGFFILQIWLENRIVLIQDDAKPISHVSFPVVTICPETKIRQTIYNFTDYYHKVRNEAELSTQELDYFADASLLCDNHLYTAGPNFTSFESISQIIQQVSPPLEQVLFACKYASEAQNCSELFTPILTNDGRCYTFNANGTKSHSGTRFGLFLLLTAYEQDFDYICRGPTQGFKLYLHEASHVPPIATNYIRVALNREVVVAVNPLLVQSSKLKRLKPEVRQCWFENEQNLKFFPKYNEENCIQECLIDYIVEKCDCVPYFFKRNSSNLKFSDNISRICGSNQNKCLHRAELSFYGNTSCNCLPSCTSLKYETQISSGRLEWNAVMKSFRDDLDDYPGIQMSRLTIFFQNEKFYPKEREFLYSKLEVWSFCGGILALFSGISFLSVAELLYFFLLRAACNIRKYGESTWGGPKNCNSIN